MSDDLNRVMKGINRMLKGKKVDLDFEYTMGNGQCDACGGTKSTFGWGTPGHTNKCSVAKFLVDTGYRKVLYASNNTGAYRSPGCRKTEEDREAYAKILNYGRKLKNA
jgi:hypothetical protein